MSATARRRRQRKRRSQNATPPRSSAPAVGELRETGKVERIAYSRRQAAEALGVSTSTIDRRVVPAVDTVKTPWGQRLIPVSELQRLLQEHIEPGTQRPRPRRAGRPVSLPDSVLTRIQLEHSRGRTLAEIARALTDEGVATAHGGRRWWPSTVRGVLLRAAR